MTLTVKRGSIRRAHFQGDGLPLSTAIGTGTLLEGVRYEARTIEEALALQPPSPGTLREWCDLISYNPEIPPVIVRVERDEGYISLLRTALEVFVPALAEKRAEVLSQLNWTCQTKG